MIRKIKVVICQLRRILGKTEAYNTCRYTPTKIAHGVVVWWVSVEIISSTLKKGQNGLVWLPRLTLEIYHMIAEIYDMLVLLLNCTEASVCPPKKILSGKDEGQVSEN